MEETIAKFVSALRKADVEVSPAETLDAMAALEVIGLKDRQLIQDSLSIILAKTPAEKARFDTTFERFFSFTGFDGDDNPLEAIQARYQATQQGNGDNHSDEEGGQARKRRRQAVHGSQLGHLLLQGSTDDLRMALQRAATAVHLERIRSLRERPLFARRILLHLGAGHLLEEISRLQQEDSEAAQQMASMLMDAHSYLEDEVRNFVERQYLLLVDGSGQRFIAEAAAGTRLTNMQPHYFEHIREAVRKLAQQLARRHARRRRLIQRGQLDVRRTIRRNVAHDGVLAELAFKEVRRQKPEVFVICDVSGSVANVARFLLTFLYSLNEVLPNVRAFAFSSDLGEVTTYFSDYALDDAIEMAMDDYGKGSTDYGKAFTMFRDLCLGDLGSRSTVMILGDSRNNYFENGTDALKDISRHARQVIWLNPEARERWSTGDAEMKQYLPLINHADVCNSLTDLERIVSRVLKSAQ